MRQAPAGLEPTLHQIHSTSSNFSKGWGRSRGEGRRREASSGSLRRNSHRIDGSAWPIASSSGSGLGAIGAFKNVGS